MSTLKFGWHMPSFPVDGSDGSAFLDQIHQTLDRVPPHFDSVWVDDHMMPWGEWQSNDTPFLECLSTIAYFAAAYPTLKFASSVFCQSYRNPALLAKTVANLQLLTGGRFIFGIGAGWMVDSGLYRFGSRVFDCTNSRFSEDRGSGIVCAGGDASFDNLK